MAATSGQILEVLTVLVLATVTDLIFTAALGSDLMFIRGAVSESRLEVVDPDLDNFTGKNNE